MHRLKYVVIVGGSLLAASLIFSSPVMATGEPPVLHLPDPPTLINIMITALVALIAAFTIVAATASRRTAQPADRRHVKRIAEAPPLGPLYERSYETFGLSLERHGTFG